MNLKMNLKMRINMKMNIKMNLKMRINMKMNLKMKIIIKIRRGEIYQEAWGEERFMETLKRGERERMRDYYHDNQN